jgi:uncharacterized OB-fold protein
VINATGVVYTETVVHLAPEALSAEAPYQLVIVETDGKRHTGRLRPTTPGERVSIGDAVELVEELDGVSFYKRA